MLKLTTEFISSQNTTLSVLLITGHFCFFLLQVKMTDSLLKTSGFVLEHVAVFVGYLEVT